MTFIKCVVVGDESAGKSSLVKNLISDVYSDEYVPTVFSTYTKTVFSCTLNGDDSCQCDTRYDLSFWDTAGCDEYCHLRKLSYPQTDVYILCFSLANRQSFENIKIKWLDELKSWALNSSSKLSLPNGVLPIILVGTKADLAINHDLESDATSDIVGQEEIDQLIADFHFAAYIETSARCRMNVDQVQSQIISMKYDKAVVEDDICVSTPTEMDASCCQTATEDVLAETCLEGETDRDSSLIAYNFDNNELKYTKSWDSKFKMAVNTNKKFHQAVSNKAKRQSSELHKKTLKLRSNSCTIV